MSSRRYRPKPAEGKEIPISVLGIEQREEMLWISLEPVLQDDFPPCIKNIVQKPRGKKGRHRAAAILAAFLGQAGWSGDEAKRIWSNVAGVEERIFAEWFGKMHCPKCETLKQESKSYPDLGIADLGYCQPDEKCPGFEGPIEYSADVRTDDDRSRGEEKNIKTLFLVRVFDWATGREGEIELSCAEKDELEGLLADLAEQKNKVVVYTRAKVRGRLRPRFYLKETEGPTRRILSEFL
jgi:hypothetical protein